MNGGLSRRRTLIWITTRAPPRTVPGFFVPRAAEVFLRPSAERLCSPPKSLPPYRPENMLLRYPATPSSRRCCMDFVLLGDDTYSKIVLGIGAVLGASLFLYLYLSAQRLRKNGIPLQAWIVQANDALYEPGGDDRPAVLLLSLPGPRQASNQELAELAARMSKLRPMRNATGADVAVRELVVNERFRPGFQTVLPREFTGGSEVHCVHMEIRRDYLSKEGVLEKPYVQVAALRTKDVETIEWIMMPYPNRA
jgi:hypothetical protein